MEQIPDDISPVELREELHSRTRRAGYTTREGGKIPLKIISMPSNDRYRKNYIRIFGHD